MRVQIPATKDLCMPRVAMLIQKYYPHVGGAERQVQRLAPLLQARGFDVCVITRHAEGLPSEEMIDGVPVYRVPARGPKAVAALSYIFSTVRLLSKLHPDLIHAHEILSPASTAVFAKFLFGVPVIVKILRGGILGDIYKIKRRPLGLQRFHVLSRNIDAFVVISQEIDQELAELQVPPEKRAFISNGVDTEVFAPLSDAEKQNVRTGLDLLPGALLVVYLGRLTGEKRVDHLLRIWPAIRAACPQAELIVVGTGDEEISLRAQAASLAGVRFTGAVDDAMRYLQAADLFVLPSATEGLSNSMLEALSTGLPVLATSVGGTPDVITHNVNGYLIPPDDVPALQNSLLQLLADGELRARLGREARQRILNNFSLESVAARLETLYHHVMSSQ